MVSKINETHYVSLYATAEKQIVLSNGEIFSSEELEDVVSLVRAPKEIQKKMLEVSNIERINLYKSWLEQKAAAEPAAKFLEFGSLQWHLFNFNMFISNHKGWDLEWVAIME